MFIIKRRPYLIGLAREIFYNLANPVQSFYWFLFRPYRPGAKTFLFANKKLLLVRIGYKHKRFVLPGGGIQKEEPVDAAIRELYEEAGIKITNPDYIGKCNYTNQYKKVTVFYYTKEIYEEDIIIDGQEIIDAGWFDLNDLPKNVAPRLIEELEMYNNWKITQKI